MTISIWRTNAFAVRDRAQFEALIAGYMGDAVIEADDALGGRVVLFSAPNATGIPKTLRRANGGDCIEMPLPDAVARHLVPGEVAIFVLAEVDGGNERITAVLKSKSPDDALAAHAEGSLASCSADAIAAAVASLVSTPARIHAAWASGHPLREPVDQLKWRAIAGARVRLSFKAGSSLSLQRLADRFFDASAALAFEPLPNGWWSAEFKREGGLLEMALETLGVPASLPEGESFATTDARRQAAEPA